MVIEENKITLPSKLENISVIEHFIDDVCAEFNLSEEYYGNILVAVTEAVNNAIMHGNKLNPEKNFHFSFQQKNDELLFTVKDEGKGFDINQVPDPTDPLNIENPHGRGIFLMQHLADKVEFNCNGAEITLHFKINPVTLN
jgi:serine/threonine-protein kinase RsbW